MVTLFDNSTMLQQNKLECLQMCQARYKHSSLFRQGVMKKCVLRSHYLIIQQCCDKISWSVCEFVRPGTNTLAYLESDENTCVTIILFANSTIMEINKLECLSPAIFFILF